MLGDATSMSSYYCSSRFFVSLKLCPITIYHIIIQYRISVSLWVFLFFLYIKRKTLITKTKKKKTKKRTRRDETKRQPVVAQIQKDIDIIRCLCVCLCVCVCVCGNDSHYFISHGYTTYDGNATFYSRFTSRFTIIIFGRR